MHVSVPTGAAPAPERADAAPGAGSRAGGGSGYRPEIQGLRAVAVLLVAAYHIWLGRVSGGVDVFLLLTGFLITGSLVRAVERRGRVGFTAFWARLLGRLTPPAALVLLGTLVATALWLPQSRWRDVIAETVATALYHENWYLAANAVDYLARDSDLSPLQHFWSLSIQWQFYLLWPVLIALAALVARRRGWGLRPVVLAALGAVAGVSFAYSVRITGTDQAWAYFDTGARLWEPALGGALAIVLPHLRLPRAPRVAMGWLGLAALVSCGILLQVSTMFPGWIALWPTGAAVLVVVAGTTGSRFGADRLLTWRPLHYIGDISYALYLWHWPVLVVYLGVADRQVASPLGGCCVLAVSLALAAATKWLVEGGVQRFVRTRSAPLWSVAVAVVCLLPVFTAAGGWSVHLDRQELHRRELASDPGNYPGAAVLAADFAGPVPDVPVLPAPADADGDQGENKEPGGCHDMFEATTADPCVDGPADAERTVALIGHSHIAHWYPAMREAAERNGWRLITMTKDACHFTTGPWHRGRDDYPECEAWNADVMAGLAEDPPDVVVTHATRSSIGNGEQVLEGYEERWAELAALGSRVVALRDTPRMGFDAPECVARNGADSPECETEFTLSLAQEPPYERLSAASEATFIDLDDYVCPDGRCRSVIGNVLVYYDESHMTGTFSRTLAPALETELKAALGW
ncbi:peptidoglycan/LPS O-acetylase OafA/YrhL [Spinactinospora alkalitolerans]|uniref:Peptidoglycan/LPS O-acetylase OafA/YrhL n=1 Tax=Spinactinospora alkalitolerans TaxID=687207 RepID=A0A852U0R6_9ACTN|nr:SGNH hydrolase domain-containing protein [Spinactinospora alkalitolerans]NYE49701.1 peptidoglycan/LPS O-acetylase OafA/YrhL [Spinactinospora alkalitolerans]